MLQWRGSTSWGHGQRVLGDVGPSVGPRGKDLVGVLRDEVPQKLKQNMK